MLSTYVIYFWECYPMKSKKLSYKANVDKLYKFNYIT